jgi:hypothetical protein
MTEKEISIFISYRREDSAYAAGRLFDRLSDHFGADHIFMDIDTIQLGVDFVNRIETAVEACDVLIAIIGNKWVDVTDSEGQRRLDNPNDFVRLEISSALARDIHVIPVLVDDASMPDSTDLPDDLAWIARRHGIEISHTRFNTDAQKLISGIESIFETKPGVEHDDEIRIDAEEISAVQEETKGTVSEPRVIETTMGEDPQPIKRQKLISFSEKPLQRFAVQLTVGLVIIGVIGPTLTAAIPISDNNIWIVYQALPSSLFGCFSGLWVGVVLRKFSETLRRSTALIVALGWSVAGAISGAHFGYQSLAIIRGEYNTNFSWIFLFSIITIFSAAIRGLSIGAGLQKSVEIIKRKQVVNITGYWLMGSIVGVIINQVINFGIFSQISSYFYETSSNPRAAVMIGSFIFSLITSIVSGMSVGLIGGRSILSSIDYKGKTL